MDGAACSGIWNLMSDRDETHAWREAARLGVLGACGAAISASGREPNALCDEFLDLCSMHRGMHPGEPRLARIFLAQNGTRGSWHRDGEEAVVMVHAFAALVAGLCHNGRSWCS